jgi:hypothetical protein
MRTWLNEWVLTVRDVTRWLIRGPRHGSDHPLRSPLFAFGHYQQCHPIQARLRLLALRLRPR